MNRVLFLSMLGLFASAPALRAEDLPINVIARAVKAHGGQEALSKFKAGMSSGKGKIYLQDLGEFEFTQSVAYKLPDKFKESFSMTVKGTKIDAVTRVNGDKFSIEAMGKEVDLDDKSKEAIKGVGHMLLVAKLYPLLTGKDYELSFLGEDTVEGKPAVGIHVTSKGKKDINLYFDKKTNLLMKIESRAVDPINKNEIKEERIFTEYGTNKEGLAVVKKAIIKHDGKLFIEIELSDFQLLEELDDSEFTKP